MATKEFTSKQKEIVARKMGYNGPMQMFDEYLKSNPADEMRYSTITEKFMARGGMASKRKKFAVGGATVIPTAQEAGTTKVDAVTGIPTQPDAAQIAPALQVADQSELMKTELAPTKAATITPAATVTAAQTAAPTVTPTATMQAATAAPAVSAETGKLQAEQGQVSAGAQVQAAQVTPTQTAVGTIQAAQDLTPTTVQGAPTREVQAGELISGPTVDQTRVAQTLTQAQAAQGAVTPEMTVQGQLNTLLADFDAGNPPPWAAASLRNATAQLAARGLGASSLAGQAIIQATLEAATPIAAADAKVFETMGLTNLSNRQQMAVLTAQQRAQFLGQEFDQAFQTKVLNAAKVADVANMNFTAQQQIALENARMAQTMDLANLSNRQAVVMANAAQIANLETQNLNNRQQAAVANAQAFLQMDMTNLSNRQQTALFRSQQNIQSILSDQAAENAARQFNASSENQTNQFFANLRAQVDQFNTTQRNAMAQYNTDKALAVAEYNANAQNARDQFNAQNRLVIDQSNAQWRREISTANTAAINRANEFNATKAMEVTMTEYNNLWQQARDEIEYAWKSSESAADRVMELAKTEIAANATIVAKGIEKDATIAAAAAKGVSGILGGTTIASDAINWGISTVKTAGTELWKWITAP